MLFHRLCRTPVRLFKQALTLLVTLALTVTATTSHADTKTNSNRVLKIINWGEYIAPDVLAKFERAYGVTIEYTGYYSVEEFSGYFFEPDANFDVVFPASRVIPRLTELGLLEGINTRQLPRFAQLRPDVLQQYQQQENGDLHAIPYMWGTTGLGVNTHQLEQLGIGDYKNSWALLFDANVRAKASQCGIGLLNERDELFAAALVYLGYSANTTDKSELMQAGNLLKEAIQDAQYLHPNQYRQDLTAGRICVAVGYSGNILQDIAQHPDYAYYIPREGAAMWIDVMAVAASSQNKTLAYQFIDFLMRPENAAANTNLMAYPTAMASAEPMIDKHITENPAIYPPQLQLTQLEALIPQDKQATRIKHRLWVSAICSGRSWCSVPMTSFF
ncbi:extracellular solute-binding protein [Oceanobacter kriegii]|uniref:extracellular solute-binding protein n=1 Tax=Oceanobacter kriegii TaxID=64972 RepID=UPI0005611CFC|nr:extracellular solute-binding protein [Oceanobacter kriegii]